ncbi:DUF1194 domain-containing protein [Roseovarius indicus]|uniref:DUF1194 domain-containing protein n=1 Tax=Roseovarius indicus TaxID=540747 RepID=UPI0009EE37F0|nr:DUF1194 domain-containing protein [Roseovarius indicus]
MRALARVVALAALMLATPAHAACRQALALGLDVSGSVDMWEYRLQLDGLAGALLDPEVQAAFLLYPETPVRLMVYEWSAQTHQRVVIGWRDIAGPADLLAVAQVLQGTRSVPVNNPSTAIGAAMAFGAAELQTQADCWRMTLDISGDGPSNVGRHPRLVEPHETGRVVINGLVIGPDGPSNTTKNRHNVKSLMGYYQSYVIRGPGAFVVAALDYEDFAEAMRRKLIRELQPAAVSRDPTGAGRSVDIADLVGPVPFDPAQ